MIANRPMHEIFLENVRKCPNKEAYVEIGTHRRVTFMQFNDLTNRYANFFKDEGYEFGDVISLFMSNSIDYVAVWMGLTLETVFGNGLMNQCKIYVIDTTAENHLNVFHIKDKILKQKADEPKSPSSLNFQSILCYIYTSGTTGHPKPAIIKHFSTFCHYVNEMSVIMQACNEPKLRFYVMVMGCGKSFNIMSTDRIYVTMPMYHSSAGIIGVGQALLNASTCVIRKKFSASNFWIDCINYECTVSQYIGEMCRYLLAQKEIPEEKLHKVRLMYGNGLRIEIWRDFVTRFHIAKIGEFYGSTEGNSNIVNIDNRIGACGFFPVYAFLAPVYPVRLLKTDEKTGEILRNKNGLCIACRPGETGEMVGLIKNNDLLLRFEGYVNNEETNKKIIRNAFRFGDAVFSSGDLIYWDEYGYLYFKDRRGDTFRYGTRLGQLPLGRFLESIENQSERKIPRHHADKWKGENVSTTEVEGILQPIKELSNIIVYGVEIPTVIFCVTEQEGRAGMVAVVSKEGTSHDQLIDKISSRLKANLPQYAIPVFLRFCDKLDMTGTFKLKKVNLQRDGFNLERCCDDAIYLWNSSNAKYM
ncbi:unnamed protein product [Anisakis simplex]|uniref:Long-chain-fatty-acid--CoA ligase n=1 Tax=Anisakis simplex TaxID=6269 RepID=A0A158PN67_ANISI|nr:unnamed protein product [Anisakis simplex]